VNDSSGSSRKAGAFDIRNVIALLLGAYGVLLVVLGLVHTSDADLAKADGLNINVWGGLGMIVAAAGFALWARLRPIVVPDESGQSSSGQPSTPDGRS